MEKTITIKRRPNHTNLPDHIYESSKKRIGSSFTAKGTVNTGLSRVEIQKYMPDIIDVEPDDRNFRRAVNQYFMNLSIDIPPAGLDLEVGLDNKKVPLELEDWIKYKFALVHPYVIKDIKDPQERRRKRKYVFFIEDHAREKEEAVVARKLRKEALKEYIKISADEEKTAMVLRVFGKYPDGMDPDSQINDLEELALEDPQKFISVVKNKDLELRAFIQKCLSSEALRKVGNTYLDGEEILGNTEEEVVLYLKDKKNSETLLLLKSRLKEFSK